MFLQSNFGKGLLFIHLTLYLYYLLDFCFTEKSAYLIFGIFMALAYGLPTVGGFIADKLLGV
jgi:dipeptide/tripeptide permease